MFESNFSKNIQSGEEIVAIVKRHPVALVGPMSLYGLLLILDFFFMPWLLRQSVWGGIVFGALLVVCAVGLWRSFFIWSLNAFVLTNERLLDFDQRGFFYRVVSATSYNKIQDVSYSTKGIWQSLFRIGTIHVQTAGSQANLELYSVAQPEKAVEQINSIMQKDPAAQPPIPTQEFVSLVSKMRKSLGNKAVDELLDKAEEEGLQDDTIPRPTDEEES